MKSQTVNLIFTLRCNASCDFCYERHVNATMSKDTVKNTIEYFYGTNVDHLDFWLFGGEAVLEEDLVIYALDLIEEHSNTTGITASTILFTNGIYFNEAIVKRLVEFNKNELTRTPTVQISFEGDSNYKRDMNGLHRPTILKNIKRYKDSGLVCTVRATFSHDNLITDKELYHTFKQIVSFGITGFEFFPVIECEWTEQDLVYWDKAFRNIKNFMIRNAKKKLPSIEFKPFALHRIARTANDRGCGAGTSFCSVDSVGDVYTCHKASSNTTMSTDKYKLGSVLTKEVAKFEKPAVPSICDNCEVMGCAQCFITNYATTGDEGTLPNNMYCKIQKIIWKHYIDYLAKLTKLGIVYLGSDEELILLEGLVSIGSTLGLDLRRESGIFADDFFNISDIICTKLADGIAPLPQILLSTDTNIMINRVLLHIETIALYMYNAELSPNIDDEPLQRLVNILRIITVLYENQNQPCSNKN